MVGMTYQKRKLPVRPLLLLVVAMVLVSGLLFSCTGTGTVPRGWSGGTIADATLFIGTMEGKLTAIDVASRNRKWPDVQFEAPKTSGGFGCSQTASTVAIYGTPAIGKGLVYVGGYDGRVYAINASTGALRWVYPRQGYLKPVVGGVVVALDKVYFGSSDGKVYALDAETGDQAWSLQTGGKIWSSPAIADGTLYIGSFDKKLYALDAANGSNKWAPFETEGAITSAALVSGDTVYFGSFDRHLYAVNASNGTQRWKSGVQAGNWFWAGPVVNNDILYAGSLDGKVYGLKIANGDKVAEFDLGDSISSPPILVNSLLIVASQNGRLFALDTENNKERLLVNLKEPVYASLTASGDTVYVHTAKDVLHAIDAKTGTKLWDFPLKS